MKDELIRDRDIVIVGQQSWDVEIGSNCKNIAEEFCKHNRVLYVNAPLDRITAWKSSNDEKVKKRLCLIKNKEKGLFKIQENLWNLYPDTIIESINWIGSDKVYNLFNKLNNRKFSKSIQKALDELGFKDIILFNDNDISRSFYLKELLKPQVSIYYSRDYMLGVDYWKKHGEVLEPLLIAKSDICTANSMYLKEYCGKYNSKSYYVGQGCDFEAFKNVSDIIPADIERIKYPIIGYVGALQGLRLDIELLAGIATAKPDWQIVLVGPEDESFKLSRLHHFSNIHFLGSKPPQQLASYIKAFDVCINPQIVNEVTIGNYPRKIDEYLILGKPIVATKTETMKSFGEHVYLAENKEDYLELIEKTLKENSEVSAKSRIEFASSHTWENSVKEIYKAINSHILCQ